MRMQNCIDEASDEDYSPSPFFPGEKGAVKVLDSRMEDNTPMKKRPLHSQNFRIAPKKIQTETKKPRFESLARPKSVYFVDT